MISARTVSALFDRTDALINPLSLGPLTHMWVCNAFRKGPSLHLRTTLHGKIDMVLTLDGSADVPLGIVTMGATGPVLHLSLPQHPLAELFSVLTELIGYAGGTTDFQAAFDSFVLSRDGATAAPSALIRVTNALTKHGYEIELGNELTVEAIRQRLDTLIASMPRLTQADAADCVDAINERLRQAKTARRAVTVTIEGLRATVTDNRGDTWSDLSSTTTPAGLAGEFLDVLDEDYCQTVESAAQARQYDDELSAEERR